MSARRDPNERPLWRATTNEVPALNQALQQVSQQGAAVSHFVVHKDGIVLKVCNRYNTMVLAMVLEKQGWLSFEFTPPAMTDDPDTACSSPEHTANTAPDRGVGPSRACYRLPLITRLIAQLLSTHSQKPCTVTFEQFGSSPNSFTLTMVLDNNGTIVHIVPIVAVDHEAMEIQPVVFDSCATLSLLVFRDNVRILKASFARHLRISVGADGTDTVVMRASGTLSRSSVNCAPVHITRSPGFKGSVAGEFPIAGIDQILRHIGATAGTLSARHSPAVSIYMQAMPPATQDDDSGVPPSVAEPGVPGVTCLRYAIGVLGHMLILMHRLPTEDEDAGAEDEAMSDTDNYSDDGVM